VTGSINVDGTSGRAELSMPLSGPKARGSLNLKARKADGAWTFSRLVVEFDDGRRIDLLRGSSKPGEVQTVRSFPGRADHA
jgi:hypothetical protein